MRRIETTADQDRQPWDLGENQGLIHTHHRLYIDNAAYIVYVTSLAILRTVTARGKLAGVTNDKESVLL